MWSSVQDLYNKALLLIFESLSNFSTNFVVFDALSFCYVDVEDVVVITEFSQQMFEFNTSHKFGS